MAPAGISSLVELIPDGGRGRHVRTTFKSVTRVIKLLNLLIFILCAHLMIVHMGLVSQPKLMLQRRF